MHVQANVNAELADLTLSGGCLYWEGSSDGFSYDSYYSPPERLLGGGVLNEGNLNISGATIANNSANRLRGEGGGVFNRGTMTISGATIANNSADYVRRALDPPPPHARSRCAGLTRAPRACEAVRRRRVQQ